MFKDSRHLIFAMKISQQSHPICRQGDSCVAGANARGQSSSNFRFSAIAADLQAR